MMRRTSNPFLHVFRIVVLLSCAGFASGYGLGRCLRPRFPQGEGTLAPRIVPDYTGVTLPPNIAPPAFALAQEGPASGRTAAPAGKLRARFQSPGNTYVVRGRGGQIRPPRRLWKKLLAQSQGGSLQVTLAVKGAQGWQHYAPFIMEVAEHPIDPCLLYRRIEPGYETWHEMGLYQRHLGSYREQALVTNNALEQNCVNCHALQNRDPQTLLFHVRGSLGATYVVDAKGVEKLLTKTPQTRSNLVYPAWHPGGRWVAFSVNATQQYFYLNHPNRIEVGDSASDVVVYDSQSHRILTCPQLFSPTAFETFPAFSADGNTLYFCSADSLPMPERYQEVRYSLCALAFDPQTGAFGQKVDTLVSAALSGKSVSFPRPSPNGRWLLYTLSDYGNFSIWHKEADLHLLELATGEELPASALNSPDVESYHSWSGNSHWVVFSSRRDDGLYTRPFLAYVNDQGRAAKPFALPQRRADHSRTLLQSYNLPEFASGPVRPATYRVARAARKQEGTPLVFEMAHEPAQ